MYSFKLRILSTVLVFVGFTGTSTADERTCSRFECEYKILERMVLLEYKNADLEKEQVICERKIEELGEIWKEQRIEMERLFKKQTESMVAMEKHESDIRRIEETTAGTNVAFTAVLSTHTLYSPNQVLVFDRIVTNVGNGYSGNTGKFTAPSKGVYLFSLTIFAFQSGGIRVDLMKNGKWFGSTYSEDKPPGLYDSASVTVVTALSKGDTVYANFDHGSTKIHSHYTTFTGIQIQ